MRFKYLLSVPHWKARLLLWGAAAAVGVAAVAFAGLADVAQTALRHLVGVSPWWPWLLAPVGFFAIAWLTQRYYRGAEGSSRNQIHACGLSLGIPSNRSIRRAAGDCQVRSLSRASIIAPIYGCTIGAIPALRESQ